MRSVVFILGLVGLVALPAHADPRFALTPLSGEAPLAIPGHKVIVRPGGELVIDTATVRLLPAEWKSRVSRLGFELTGDTLTLVAEYEQPGERHNKPVWDLGGVVFARVDLATSRIVWRNRMWNYDRDRAWTFITTPDRIYMHERRGLAALDRSSGTIVWRLYNDTARSILVPKIYDTMTLARDVLTVGGHYYNGEQRVDFVTELDSVTGLRIYRAQPYVAPTPQPIYVRGPYYIEYAGDRAPPEVPQAWDGLRFGYAYLMWNTVTGEGIIVNPTKNDAAAIVALAKRQRYRVKGEARPVHWLAVYATHTALMHSVLENQTVVLARHKKQLANDQRIHLVQDGDLEESGEVIDAQAVAAKLDAKVIERSLEQPLSTTAGPVLAYSDALDGNRGAHVYLEWGPYVVFDRDPGTFDGKAF